MGNLNYDLYATSRFRSNLNQRLSHSTHCDHIFRFKSFYNASLNCIALITAFLFYPTHFFSRLSIIYKISDIAMPLANLKKQTYSPEKTKESVLPKVLQTPSGLALLEIQGTIHIGKRQLTSSGGLGLETQDDEVKEDDDEDMSDGDDEIEEVGKFDFSDLEKGGSEVVLQIGKFQRLRGKLIKLKMPLAVLRIDPVTSESDEPPVTQEAKEQSYHSIANDRDAEVEVPILDIVYHKILFATRPEPIVYG